MVGTRVSDAVSAEAARHRLQPPGSVPYADHPTIVFALIGGDGVDRSGLILEESPLAFGLRANVLADAVVVDQGPGASYRVAASEMREHLDSDQQSARPLRMLLPGMQPHVRLDLDIAQHDADVVRGGIPERARRRRRHVP